MSWNHKEQIFALGVAIQAEPGVFVQPGLADLMAVSAPANTRDPITADDPTGTGTGWTSPRILLGKTGTAGANFPFRGPGGAGPPLANAWPFGRVMQSAGWTEIRNAANIAGVTQAGSTVNSLVLAAGESAVDDFYIGAPILHAALGAGNVRGASIIMDYDGAAKRATLPETIVAPGAGTAYNIPPFLSYVQGNLVADPPLLSISVWRHRRRYDYVDCRPTSLAFDIPVGNEQNTGFPACEFSFKGTPIAVAQNTAQAVPLAVRQIPIMPARDGKFVLDRVPLGHGGIRYTQTTDAAAASNQNQKAGQDQQEIMSGARTLGLDLNQMDFADFDFEAREDNQTVMAALSLWGGLAGNRFAFLEAGHVIDPLNPGTRNGFVSLTGDAHPVAVDKAAALAIWWNPV